VRLELHVTSWVFPRGHRDPALAVQRHVADDLAELRQDGILLRERDRTRRYPREGH
jgi:hypothetical protein